MRMGGARCRDRDEVHNRGRIRLGLGEKGSPGCSSLCLVTLQSFINKLTLSIRMICSKKLNRTLDCKHFNIIVPSFHYLIHWIHFQQGGGVVSEGGGS